MTDDDFLDHAAKAIATLEAIESDSYWESPIPSATDKRIAAIIDLYIDATPLQRDVIRTAQRDYNQAMHTCSLLTAFADRMATLAVRRRSEPILTRALLAVVICSDWIHADARDCGAFIGPLLAYCSLVIGADRDRLYGLAHDIAKSQWAKTVTGRWPDDIDPDELLRQSTFRAVAGPAGVVFQWQNRPIPAWHLVPEVGSPGENGLPPVHPTF